MERLTPGPLAQALERRRERYNARAAQARRMRRGLDLAEFGRHLVTRVAPIVDAVAQDDSNPETIDRVVEALFDVSLELAGKDLLGLDTPQPALAQTWNQLLPRLARLLLQDPRRLAASLSNAAYNLDRETAMDGPAWIQALARSADHCATVEQLLDAGAVLAWRAGMAHYRESALQILARLPESLVRELLGLGDNGRSPHELIEAMSQDPWARPGHDPAKPLQLRIAGRVGGFRGYGGAFVEPPEVRTDGDVIYAFDREGCHAIHAGCFGATLRRVGPEPPTPARPPSLQFRLERDGTVSKGRESAGFPLLAGAAGFAATETTLAVALSNSHYVFLVALMRA